MKTTRRTTKRERVGSDARGDVSESDDHDLWQHVASTVEPLRAIRRVGTSRRAQEDKLDRPKKGPVRAPAPVTTPSRTASTSSRQSAKSGMTPRPTPPTPASLDRRQTRRLANGRTEIGARIDLHGMRQSEAHAALTGFLARASADGQRTVLVITGKGRSPSQSAPSDIVSERRDQGVLRRLVPVWLMSDAAIAPLVIAHSPASQRHGGEGALYVTLRIRTSPRR